MTPRKNPCFWLFTLVVGAFTCASGLAVPQTSPQGDRVLQFSLDPLNADQAWMLTRDNLQFNTGLKTGGRWQVKFDKTIFKRVTSSAASDEYRHRKIQISRTRPGTLYLLVENGEGNLMIFRTADYGEFWKYSPVNRAQQESAMRPKPQTPSKNEPVDLSTLNDSPTPTPRAAESGHRGGLSQPIFKILFDLLLHVRPGISPWTFDNYHTLFLVDIIPRPELHFSFEVSPSPRYYELAYQFNEKLQFRGGRIWIPFDDMNPHNTFGGFMNTSQLRQPGGIAFLPDLWTDLGVAARYQILDSRDLSLSGHLYIVNGFQSGGTDPLGEVSSYPNFSGTPAPDNNNDKAVGARFQGVFQKFLSAGVSVYSARYTSNDEDSKRILMLGLDSQIRPVPALEFRFGYTFTTVALPEGASSESFTRGGVYGEGKYKFMKNWFAGLRGGIQQPDDRISDLNDQVLLGGRVGYEADWFQLSVQHHKDLKDAPGKANREYSALRFVLML